MTSTTSGLSAVGRNGHLIFNARNDLVDLLVAYSNRPDLREQLQRTVVILSEKTRQDDEPDSSPDSEVPSTTRWWSLRDRFSPEDLQTMIDLYKSGATAKQVAEKFNCQRAQRYPTASPA
ncbi:MAG: hypothetical protein ACRDRS_19595 [Pseudonocardiaceae bacterium]